MIIISGGKIFVNLWKCKMGQTSYKNQREGHMSSYQKDWDKSSELPPHFPISVITPLVESPMATTIFLCHYFFVYKNNKPILLSVSSMTWMCLLKFLSYRRNLVYAPEGVGQLSQAWFLVREHIWPPSLSPSRDGFHHVTTQQESSFQMWPFYLRFLNFFDYEPNRFMFITNN